MIGWWLVGPIVSILLGIVSLWVVWFYPMYNGWPASLLAGLMIGRGIRAIRDEW